MLKKLYIGLAIIFVASTVVYFIYQNPNVPSVANLTNGTNLSNIPFLNKVIPTPQPTFNTTPLFDLSNQRIPSPTPLITPPPEPFCVTEPCASTVVSIELAFKNCQVQAVTSIYGKPTKIQLTNGQFIDVPRTPEGQELEIQSMINTTTGRCPIEPVWTLE